MSTNAIRRKYVWQAALLTIASVMGSSAYFYFSPRHYFGAYSLIPIFFFALGIFAVSMIEKCRKRSLQRLSQVYLILRVMRMLLSLIVMVAYCFLVDKENVTFLLLFIVNYLTYMIFDSWFFIHYERRTRYKKME